MSGIEGFGDKVAFIWSVADLLRGDIRQHEYGQFILPFVVLRRLDCVLEPTKADVMARAKALEGKIGNVDPILERVSGAPFYNTSPLTFTGLLNDDKNIRANLNSYVAGFSSGAAEVLEKYRFPERIETLHKAGLLYQVVAKFADIDLHPSVVPNHAMGYIFEELLRRFSEMQNETAGEHFTPREVIKAMVHILFAEDEKALSGPAPVRTMYDPACGTGGMLSSGQDYLAELNPEAHLEVYGQELNPETWAICRSDMLIKGENPENIVLGNSLSADGHADQPFDYMLANPPFGVDWKKYAEPLIAEAENEGWDGRFGAGLPRSSDGSFLFLQHMLSKMKPVHKDPATGEQTGGSRIAIVFSGSPLSSGGAGSGESNIRKWIIENDWLEAVIALPDQMFYNTVISTYFWVVTNRKRSERIGKVTLIDARGMATKMRKGLGNKRNYLTDDTIADLTRLYADAPDLADDSRVQVLPNEAFGFQRITVEQPLRRRWEVTDESLAALGESKAWGQWECSGATPGPGRLVQPEDVFAAFVGEKFESERECLLALSGDAVAGIPPTIIKELVKAAAVADTDAPVVTDKRGRPLPDPDLRDIENVPLGESADEYLEREVRPFAAEAWIDHAKTKIGYQIRFGRHFWVPRDIPDIPDLNQQITALETELRFLSSESLTSSAPSLVHCPLVRAKWLFRERNERGADAPLGSVISDVGVVLRDDLQASVMNPGDDLSTYKLVQPNDFVIGLRSFQHGIVASQVRALVSPAYTVLTPTRRELVPFLRHYLRSRDLIDRLEVISSGIRQGRTIAYSEFRELPIPVPSGETLDGLVQDLDAHEDWMARLRQTQAALVRALHERANVLLRHRDAGVL